MPEHQVRWTRYGAAAHQALREVVGEAKRSAALAPVTVLVPSNLAGVAARRHLAARVTEGPPKQRGIAGLRVMTVDRLAEQLGAAGLVGTGRRPASGAVLAAAWRATLAADPGIFAAVLAHPATVRALVDAHRTLRDLSPTAIDAIAASGALTGDLVRLHRQVLTLLTGSWYDAADVRATAAQILENTPGVDRSLGVVVMFLPQDLDLSQAAVAKAVAAATELVVIAGLTGDTRADGAVVRSVQRMGLPVDGAPAVSAPTASTIRHASDADDEVRMVVRDILDSVSAHPAHQVAVLYGAAVPYARLLHEQLAAAGVVVNGTGVRPMSERVMARAMVDLLALAGNGLDRGAVFRLLASAPVRGRDGHRVPSSRWERISRAARVAGADSWGLQLAHYAKAERARAATERGSDTPRDWLVQKLEREALDTEELHAFIDDLKLRLTTGGAATDWSTLARWGLDTYRALLGGETTRWQLPPEEARAAQHVEQILHGLVGLEAVEASADLPALREVVELGLGDELPRVGVFGTGVLVAPLSAAVGLDVDRVFVLGLAEDLCPGRAHEDALLPEHAREATATELPAARERLDRKHRHLLAAFAAGRTVVASFPRGDLRRSSQRLPSRWLLPSLRMLSGKPDLAASNWDAQAGPWLVGSPSFSASITRTPSPATAQEWRLRTLAAGRSQGRPASLVLPDDRVIGRAVALIEARASASFTRFDGNLSGHASELPDPADGITAYSPTRLESWTKCPYGYFINRVLGISPIDQPEELLEITPADIGNLMHETLDQFFGTLDADGTVPGPDTAWTDAQRQRLQRIGGEVADGAEQEGITGHSMLWRPVRQQILNWLDLLLDDDEARRSVHRLRQVRSEMKFQGIRVDLPDGRHVLMRGSADRIDRAEDGSLVVADYKSGSALQFKDLSQSNPDERGTKLQLPIYAYGARAALGRPSTTVHAEYWFIGRKNRGERIGFTLTPEVEQRYARFAGRLRAALDKIGGPTA